MSFVQVNRDAFSKRSESFRYYVCFVPGLVFPVGGSLFSAGLEHSLLPHRLPGFNSTQKLRYRASSAKPFKLTCPFLFTDCSSNLANPLDLTYIISTIC